MILPSNSETSDQFVSERFSLSDGTETTVSDSFGVEFDGSFREIESLLDDSGQFSDSSSFVSQDSLGSGSYEW
jgi:hypothetical protein